jgi:nucleotide-binding universal stress UspA family protein
MRILLALDHSDSSATAVEYLASLRFVEPVDLEIVTVIVPVPLVALGVPPLIGAAVEDEKEYIIRRLASIAPRFKTHFRSVSVVVKIGTPAFEIRRLADESQVDLIVMGAVGHSALARVLLGSVSDYVATHANASTLVVRADRDQEAPTHPSRILLAIGHSGQDQNLVHCLRSLRLPSSTEIHVVHVIEMMTFFRQDLLERVSNFQRELRTSAKNQLEAFEQSVKEMGFVTQSHLLEESHIGEALVTCAAANSCDMVMTSDRRQSVVDRMLLGSTSRFVLRHTGCSVLIARGTEKED